MKKNQSLLPLFIALTLVFGSIGLGHADIMPPHGEGQIGLQAVVLCESLTVRKEPSASSAAVKMLHSGDQIIVQQQKDGWASCFLSDDVDGSLAGWVNRDYLAVDPAWFITEENTPVYSWNDTAAPRVALLDKDTMLPVLKSDGNWLLVGLRGAAGWIYYANKTLRPNGERFETTLVLEGMEETVRYEHIVNFILGIEMDYDYELFLRRSETDRECFISLYDDPQNPLNYLEVAFRTQDADAAVSTVCETLSETYDLVQRPHTLQNAGDCTVIDASRAKGTMIMPDLLQTVYVIPAADGSIVATLHCTIESSEGFGTRIGHMLNTLVLTRGRAR